VIAAEPTRPRPVRDREIVRQPAADIKIVVRRSSAHPVEYSIMLVAHRDGQWWTVRTFDNSHGVEEHHEHRYLGNEKQPPTVIHGSVNEAMGNALEKLLNEWPALVEEWEQTL
jgi:hypothetical protein